MTAEKQRKKILFVDDSPVDRQLSTLMLEKNGFEVVPLADSSSCLQMVEKEQPDLVLLDVMMPGVDGNQLLKMIRSRWSQLELPVIMVTAKSDASDVIESLNSGANDYISKPVEYSVALKRIQTHLAIAALSRQMSQMKEFEAISAMIATYGHEINNPLTIALGFVGALRAQYPSEKSAEKLEHALWRIADIIKKTREVLERGSLEYKKYVESAKLLKLDHDVEK